MRPFPQIRICRLICGLAALAAVVGEQSVACFGMQIRSETVAYRLAPIMKDGELQALQVTISFNADPSGRTILNLPERWGNKKDLWANLRNISVEGASSVLDDGPARRIIGSIASAPLLIHYHVVSDIDHEPTWDDGQPFAPWIRPHWFYAFGESVFAVPAGRADSPATFEWSGAPTGFIFASDLEHMDGSQRQPARSGAVGDIQESILLGGSDVRIKTTSLGGSDVRIASRGGTAFDKQDFEGLATEVIRSERDFWQEKGSPFLVTLVGSSAPERVTSLGGTGRTDAFAISIASSTPLDSIRALLAHEYFHTWNPRQLGKNPLGTDDTAGTWFSEGFTEFYAQRLLL